MPFAMDAPEVTLRPMTRTEYDAYVVRSLRDYAAQQVELGGESEEAARAAAERDFAALLPDGFATEGQWFHVAESAGRRVGILWLGRRRESDPSLLWVYDVEVDEVVRGQGYGRAVMTAAEGRARALGATRLGLNVFGGNTTARSLYDSLGYVVNAQQMSKDI